MTKQNIIEKVNTFLVDEFEIASERLLPEARLKEDVGIDSLDVVDIIVTVNQEFGVKLTNQDMAKLRTLDDFYTLIETRTSL